VNHRSQPHLINLNDSPGNVDFSSEVTDALRITDGSLVVFCCIEGCDVRRETVLWQDLQERVKPSVFVNQVDQCNPELMMDPEDMYQQSRKAVEDVNIIAATYIDELMGDGQAFQTRALFLLAVVCMVGAPTLSGLREFTRTIVCRQGLNDEETVGRFFSQCKKECVDK